MEIAGVDNLDKRQPSNALVLPFWQQKENVEPAFHCNSDFLHRVSGPIQSRDFKGKEGEIALVYVDGLPEARWILLGLGDKEKSNVERLRRSFAKAADLSIKKKWGEISVVTPHVPSLSEEATFRGMAEGLLLVNYSFNNLKHDTVKEEPDQLLKKIQIVGFTPNGEKTIEKTKTICEGVNLARDLVNGNADDITPQYLGDVAEGFANRFPQVKTTLMHKDRLEKEKMGLILAVNRGSIREPLLIVSEYKGNPDSSDCTLLVGKGITYDTGGLNLKPSGSMETMKCDMGGAAAVLGALYTVASLKLPVNLICVIPSTENCIDARSYKPGDVYSSYTGKTVEIGNTDAEGRLVLADAIAYSVAQWKPTRVIDLATLTGAMDIALGSEATGFFSSDDELAQKLQEAGDATYERVWRFPLYEEYKESLKSDIADIKNIGGRSGGAILGALFIQSFVGNLPWVHLDIAGTAYLSAPKRYNPKLGTGIGVRLLTEFFERF